MVTVGGGGVRSESGGTRDPKVLNPLLVYALTSPISVCTTFLGTLRTQIDAKGGVDTPDKVEVELRASCKTAKGKDERFVS